MPSWSDFQPFIVSGLALGGIYALSGVGLVVLYRATGVLNLAFGAVGAMGAFIAWSIINQAHAPGWVGWIVAMVALNAIPYIAMSVRHNPVLGVIALFFRNDYYATREEYVHAIAAAMRPEYEAIVDAGLLLQIDCPDLGMGRHIQFADLSLDEFRREAALNLEALNEATAAIDPDRMRMHVCWGNYEGPHHCDVPFRDVVDLVFGARPNAIAFEAANPRHAHEWRIFEDVRLPEGKVLIPGVIESKSNFIEHPELIAQRVSRYADLVGRENVMAGSDCGYGTWVGQAAVDPDVVWAKLRALREGADLV